MKRTRKVFAFVLAAAMAFAILPACGGKDVQAASSGTITVSVEKFTLGQGYLVEPEQVTFTEGENFAQVFDRLMTDHGYKYSYTGTLESGFYLQGIYEADTGTLNIPSCIQQMPNSTLQDGTVVSPPTNTSNTGNSEKPYLGEFAYSDQSGWFFFINNSAPSVGFSEVEVKDGDVARVQFTVYGYGADLGAGFDESASIALKLPNRDGVTKKIAAMKANTNYTSNATWKSGVQNALKVVSNLDSTQAQITAVRQNLNKITNTPNATTLKTVKKSGTNKMKLTWKKVANCSGYQIYRSTKRKSGYKKIYTVPKSTVTTYTTGKLKKGTMYYYKLRTYRKVGSNTYYGQYSNIKNLKLKK